MFVFLVIACIIIGYLLGSFPTSYVVSKYWGKVNLLELGEARVSAIYVYRELGWIPFFMVFVVDLLKGMLAIYISQVLTGNIWVAMVTAVATAVGHCWSVYIKYYGGQGAIVIFGMLFYTGISFSKTHVPWEYALRGIIALVSIVIFKKSTLSTIIWLTLLAAVLFIEVLAFNEGTIAMALLPLILLCVQFTKRRLVRWHEAHYKNERKC